MASRLVWKGMMPTFFHSSSISGNSSVAGVARMYSVLNQSSFERSKTAFDF